MDAFNAIKAYIPDKNDSMAKTIIKSLTSAPQNIYVPGSFKAVIDLEIDAAAQSGLYLQKCARCGEYYVRSADYDFDYCDRPQREGGTCLELMKIDDPELAEAVSAAKARIEEEVEHDDDLKIIYVDKDTVNAKMDSLYKEMAARVNVDLTQRDFSRWYQRELRLKDEILLGEAGEKELNDFIELSRGDEFASKKQPPLFEKKEESDEVEEILTENGKTVRKFVFEKVDRETTTSPISPSPNSAASTLAESEKAAMEAVRRLFNASGANVSPSARSSQQYPQSGQQYDPAGTHTYNYPSQNYQNIQQNQSGIAGGYPSAYQSYGNNPSYGNGQQYGQSYNPYRPPGASRIIRGGVMPGNPNVPEQVVQRPRTVVIPNGNNNTGRTVPSVNAAAAASAAKDRSSDNAFSKQPQSVRSGEETAEKGALFGRRADDPIFEQENDVKVYTPRRNNFRTKHIDEYIEPSPYEKLRQPLEEYRSGKLAAEQEEVVDGQLSVEEMIRPGSSERSAPANAMAAYRGYTSATLGTDADRSAERAEFSHILDGITRNDGFSKDDGIVDSDGLPVSHKTKHVMDALFGPTKVSPLIRARLNDDDDNNN